MEIWQSSDWSNFAVFSETPCIEIIMVMLIVMINDKRNTSVVVLLFCRLHFFGRPTHGIQTVMITVGELVMWYVVVGDRNGDSSYNSINHGLWLTHDYDVCLRMTTVLSGASSLYRSTILHVFWSATLSLWLMQWLSMIVFTKHGLDRINETRIGCDMRVVVVLVLEWVAFQTLQATKAEMIAN